MTSSHFEIFEGRLLLSTSAPSALLPDADPTAAAEPSAAPVLGAENSETTTTAASDTTGTYSGVLKLRKQDDGGRRIYVLNLTVGLPDASGNLAGTLSGPEFGTTTFTDGRVREIGRAHV